MSRLTNMLRYCFLGAGLPALFGTDDSGPFRFSNGGANSNQSKSAYGLELNITADDESQYAELNQGDVLALDIDETITVEFLLRIDKESVNIDNTDIAFGLATALTNEGIDDIDSLVIFRIQGDRIYLESRDDNGNENVLYDSGMNVNFGQWQRFAIDLKTGVKTQSPPFQSAGGKADIRFFATGSGAFDNESLRQIQLSQGFDMGSYIGGLQLFARIGKESGEDAATLTIREICVEHRTN